MPYSCGEVYSSWSNLRIFYLIFFFFFFFFVENLGQIQILQAQFFFPCHFPVLGIFKLLPRASVSEPLSPNAAMIGLKKSAADFFFFFLLSLSFGILLLLEALTLEVDHMWWQSKLKDSTCCIVGNRMCFSFFKTFQLSSKRLRGGVAGF